MDQRIDLNVNDQPENVETVDQSHMIILEGTVLENDWVLRKQTGSTEHANIYSVAQKGQDDDSDVTYEARSYNFDNISPQVKSNRARAIKRLSRRTVLSTTWNGLRVVIYRTGAVIQENKDKLENLEGAIVAADSACKSPEKKTTRQQESNRLRQLSRRRRVKQEKKNTISRDINQQLQDYQGHESPETESMQLVEVDANEFCFFELLYLVNGDEAIRQKVKPATRIQVVQYLVAKEKEMEIDGEEALQEFIALKECEIVFLKRTSNKFKPVLKNWSEYLDHITSQVLRKDGGGPGMQQDHHDKILPVFRMRCKILSEGLDALPNLIREAEETVQKLQPKLRDARHARENREAKLERKRLGKQIKNLEKWVASVTLGSSSYYKIAEDIISAEAQLNRLELNIDK